MWFHINRICTCCIYGCHNSSTFFVNIITFSFSKPQRHLITLYSSKRYLSFISGLFEIYFEEITHVCRIMFHRMFGTRIRHYAMRLLNGRINQRFLCHNYQYTLTFSTINVFLVIGRLIRVQNQRIVIFIPRLDSPIQLSTQVQRIVTFILLSYHRNRAEQKENQHYVTKEFQNKCFRVQR